MRDTEQVREGEEFDRQKLRNYLSREIHITGDIEVSQFPAGSSNLTYLIVSGDTEYVLRRPPIGNLVKTAHDMHREFSVLSKLSAVYPAAPRPIFYCRDTEVIGSEFYLMERRSGCIIRGRAPAILESSPELQLSVCRGFVDNLAQLHSLDYKAAGLGDLGKPQGYCRRQASGWSERYSAARTHDLPQLEKAMRWLNENVPSDSRAALIHNDYKFDNVMLDPDDLSRVLAVLDWEMVTVGDPLMDLGTTLGYWMSSDAGDHMLDMPFNPRVLMENISRRELAEMYGESYGTHLSEIVYYYVFGTVKIAVIAQQIYARYARGFTKDPRFANFDRYVGELGKIAWSSVQNSRI